MIYVASIYSLDAKGDDELSVFLRQQRYEWARDAVANLMMRRPDEVFYSPIVHYHDMANNHNLPKDFDYWQGFNRHVIDLCDAVYILCMKTHDGKQWIDSRGVSSEAEYAKHTGKPITMLPCLKYKENYEL